MWSEKHHNIIDQLCSTDHVLMDHVWITFINLLHPPFRVQKDASAASVIKDATSELGLDPSRLYVLAEVKECGGEEWVLEAGDLPVQRVLLWPRKAQDEHPQSLGFYFLLQV